MKKVLDILNKSNLEYFIVGGYVRDLLLNKHSFDIDICINTDYNTLINLFPKSHYNKEYLSISFKYNNYNFTITCFRKEYNYINNKPSKILLTNKLYDDLLRRDFTINSICLSKNNNIVDLMGGVIDLNNHVIKCIGNTYNKFNEDKTRIIRAIRLSSILDFDFDEDIKSYLIKYSYNIKYISKEYIKKELDIIFKNNYKRFFCIVEEYNLKEYLGISYNNIVDCSYYGLWAQIDNSFNFSKKDRKYIESIRMLINNRTITMENIYYLNKDICSEASCILGIDITNKVKKLNIKCRDDIDIDIYSIKKYTSNINNAYKLLEKAIINDIIPNKKDELIKYLKENI